MTNLNKIEIKALNILMSASRGLDAYSYFKRLKIPFSTFSRIVHLLCEKKLIAEKASDYFVITSEGISLITKETFEKGNRPWRQIPDKYVRSRMSTSECYIPSIRRLDKKTFQNN